MATYYYEALNNQEQEYYDRVAYNTQSRQSYKDGDFIILIRPAYFSMNYVFHMSKLRYIGMY